MKTYSWLYCHSLSQPFLAMRKFATDCSAITNFLQRLWTEDASKGAGGSGVGENSRILDTVLRETFKILLSPRLPISDVKSTRYDYEKCYACRQDK